MRDAEEPGPESRRVVELPDVLVGLQVETMMVVGDDEIRLAGNGAFQNPVVVERSTCANSRTMAGDMINRYHAALAAAISWALLPFGWPKAAT